MWLVTRLTYADKMFRGETRIFREGSGTGRSRKRVCVGLMWERDSSRVHEWELRRRWIEPSWVVSIALAATESSRDTASKTLWDIISFHVFKGSECGGERRSIQCQQVHTGKWEMELSIYLDGHEKYFPKPQNLLPLCQILE